jgi:DNA-binding GntR family transcriptional regulator
VLSRGEIVYRSLHQAIIEQALAPGSKLPEDVIGAHFGVSRTIVRAAFGRLSAEGLVDIRPKRTATVARPSLAEAKDVFEVRRGLERQVMQLVVQRWSPEMGSILEGNLREEMEAAHRDSAAVSIRLAGEFHTKLAAMSGNRLLERYVGDVVSRCSLILALYGRPHSSECAVNEHREILALLRAGDADAAVAMMDSHVGSVEKRALLKQAETPAADMDAILSRYSGAFTRQDQAVVPMRRGRRRP